MVLPMNDNFFIYTDFIIFTFGHTTAIVMIIVAIIPVSFSAVKEVFKLGKERFLIYGLKQIIHRT